ncbi:hypothetical protein JW721_06215 [Candidatus Micrarchaeota archaeon]|nr:hypothetical protein [Candidatus Micrarchaeota archaeon]
MKLFDVLRFECGNPEEYGFSSFFFLDSVSSKIRFVDSVGEALKLRNRRILIKVEGYPMDLELVRGFEGKEACFLLDFSDVIGNSGGKRATNIKRMRNFAKTCIKHSVPFAVASFANDEASIRSAEELAHIGFLIGLNRGEGRKALSLTGEILKE